MTYRCYNPFAISTNGDIVARNVYASSIQIGTGNPIQFPLEINQAGINSSLFGYLYDSSGPVGTVTSGTVNVHSVSGIWATNFYASSDQRIKTNVQAIQDDQALSVVRNLKPVCYNYIDYLKNHNQMEYGFLAQEVKTVLPYAVHNQTEFIPNVYDSADFTVMEGGTATMIKLRTKTAEHLQVRDVIKIFDRRENPLIYTVSDVNYNYFIVEANLEAAVTDQELTEKDKENGVEKNTVFVYGTRVDDFHVLDKQAIYSVSIGAMQEMDRLIQRQALRIADLEAQQDMRIKQLEDKIQLLLLPATAPESS